MAPTEIWWNASWDKIRRISIETRKTNAVKEFFKYWSFTLNYLYWRFYVHVLNNIVCIYVSFHSFKPTNIRAACFPFSFPSCFDVQPASLAGYLRWVDPSRARCVSSLWPKLTALWPTSIYVGLTRAPDESVLQDWGYPHRGPPTRVGPKNGRANKKTASLDQGHLNQNGQSCILEWLYRNDDCSPKPDLKQLYETSCQAAQKKRLQATS